MKRPNPATGNPFEVGEYILDSDWETKLWFRGFRKDLVKDSSLGKGYFYEKFTKVNHKTSLLLPADSEVQFKYKLNPNTGNQFQQHDWVNDFIFVRYSKEFITKDYYYYPEFARPCKELMRRFSKLLYRIQTYPEYKSKGSNLSLEYLYSIFPHDYMCPVLEIKMEFGGDKDTSPSLDRLDSKKPYVVGNVHWISTKANLIKNKYPDEDATKVLKYFSKL